MSATPETDAAAYEGEFGSLVVPLHVAAKLERERDEALKERDEWRQHGHREADMRLQLMGTRDDARLKVERERDEARLALLAQMAREHLTCGWCGDMMHAPPGFTPPMTTEKMKLTVKIHMLDCPKHPIRETEREVEELRAVIHETIIENLHLADGEQCTLKKLKDAIGFEISPENAKCAATVREDSELVRLNNRKCVEKTHTRRQVNFLDGERISAIFSRGVWRYQKFHAIEHIRMLAERFIGSRYEIRDSDGREITKGPINTTGWSVVAVNERPAPAADIERGLRFEFDLPLPGGKRYGRADEIVGALPWLKDGEGD